MSTEDIKLNLTAGNRLTVLEISPEFPNYNELLQRAVLLLLTSDNPELQVNGYTLSGAVSSATSAGVAELQSYASHYADALRRMLNDEDYAVDSLTIDIESIGTTANITVSITTNDGEEISGEFTL